MGVGKLSINYDVDFILIAIRSQIEDYQFAYFLNKSPFFLLKRMTEDVSCIINKNPVYFSSFCDLNEEFKRESFLIKNRAIYNADTSTLNGLFDTNQINNIAFLIPELKDFDYIIKLVGIWKKVELQKLKKFLHDMKIIESEISVNLKTIQSCTNLIF